MDKLRTTEALHSWACEIFLGLHPDDQVRRVTDAIYLALSENEWSIVMLCACGADDLIKAKEHANLVRLTSTSSFEKKWNAKVDVRIPRSAFARLDPHAFGFFKGRY